MNINPRDWYNLRLVDYVPNHFKKIKLKSSINRIKILNWIEHHTTGRYGFGVEIPVTTTTPLLLNSKVVAFELSEDATMFALFYK